MILLLFAGTFAYRLLRVLVGNYLDLKRQIPLTFSTLISSFLLTHAWGPAENGGQFRAIAAILGYVTCVLAGPLLTRVVVAHIKNLSNQNQKYQTCYNSLSVNGKQ